MTRKGIGGVLFDKLPGTKCIQCKIVVMHAIEISVDHWQDFCYAWMTDHRDVLTIWENRGMVSPKARRCVCVFHATYKTKLAVPYR